MTSYVEQEGEWRTRKINLMAVFRSFISQLRPGQELTRISLPAVLCHPFSMLEYVAQRELSIFHVLFKVHKEENALKRMLLILRWYLAIIRKETIEKKPYNPVKGETHYSWVKHEDNATTEDFDGNDYSEFISEQVSHHPPITAFTVRNRMRDIEIWSNCSFSVSFGGNSATVGTSGAGEVRLATGEVYRMSKVVPDMVINNVVWGTKYIMWNGSLTIECPDSGYMAVITCSEQNKDNHIEGHISKINTPDNIVYEFSGSAGELIQYYKPGSKKKRPLLDFVSLVPNHLNYPSPELLPELSSYNIWHEVNDAIVADDMPKADQIKLVIEQDQRDRIADQKENNTEHTGLHYQQDENGMWHFLNNISLSHYWENQPTENQHENSSDEFHSAGED
jgi:hypothetical protein